LETAGRRLALSEWEERSAADEPALRGLFLDTPHAARAAEALRAQGLQVREGRLGLSIRAGQYVGMVQLGPLLLTIRPKLPTDELWYILSYALGLDRLPDHPPIGVVLPEAPFSDLLCLALLQEAERLWRTGLRRDSVRPKEWLTSPRGRLDAAALAHALPLTSAELPCEHYVRTADIPENRFVRSGLRLASGVAYSPALRTALLSAERRWGTMCGSAPLSVGTLRAAERRLTRLTAGYAPVLRVLNLLYAGAGTPDSLDALEAGSLHLPGRLWNMALLFERFVTRFLEEHLPGEQVERQEPLHGFYRVIAGPWGLSTPLPRPDLVVRRAGRTVAVLDAKYRDMANEGLTREILYQMTVYAVAHGIGAQDTMRAVVLYPGRAPLPPDTAYAFPTAPGADAQVILRAVDWSALSRSLRSERRHEALAAEAERCIRGV
jgi:5-methylcytosine-specific restriction enzyme subunit McrC